ncbi:MAG: S8 family serine peptidase [Gammaproteobacteria bacterium]|nr:S8 family serine peptidase [Gammaproteobacteria bacterium]
MGLLISANIYATELEGVMLEVNKRDYKSVVNNIELMGGKVTHLFTHVDAIAALIPKGSRDLLAAKPAVKAAYKDSIIAAPSPIEAVPVEAAGISSEIDGVKTLLENYPADYLVNNTIANVTPLSDQGYFGSGVTVAIIDTGTAPVPAIQASVLGGENFVPGEDEPSATSQLNHPHGTQVGSTLAADIAFLFRHNSPLAQSLSIHSPESVLPCDGDICPKGLVIIPMVGTAPGASLYALKTFPAAGGGSPTSRTAMAMERAITLKQNFDAGIPSVPVSGSGTAEDPYVYDSLNIQIVNMSLGGPTLYAANGVTDQLTQVMLDTGITPVISAGNEGHAAMTGGSPGTGRGALTSGAASLAANERVLRDLQYGLGFGELYRPTEHIQMATFSSRGPTADGRISTNNAVNGFAVFVQNADGSLGLASGTSFSAPATAGVAAVLREAAPDASATQIRNAMQQSANPELFGDNSAPIDRGLGYVDAAAALALLDTGNVDEVLEQGAEEETVLANIELLGFKDIKFDNDSYSTSIKDLVPGQVAHFFVDADKHTEKLTINFNNIMAELPPEEQNALFGDDLFVVIQDAITSDEAILGGGFIATDTTIEIDNPMTGLIRIAVMGDWTNAGMISTDMTVTRSLNELPDPYAKGKLLEGEVDLVSFDVPPRVAELVIELAWIRNWSRYPTNDLDMLIYDPKGSVSFEGATLASPERVVIAKPMPGTWELEVQGYTVHQVSGDARSKWELHILADGENLPEQDD